jgi:hypothetical protein
VDVAVALDGGSLVGEGLNHPRLVSMFSSFFSFINDGWEK